MANVVDIYPDEKIGHGSPTGSDEEKRRPSYIPGPDDGALAVLQQINEQDHHHPVHWPVWKKWYIIIIYCLLQVFVTLTSTSYVSVEYLIQAEYGGSTQVVTLGQSLFIVYVHFQAWGTLEWTRTAHNAQRAELFLCLSQGL